MARDITMYQPSTFSQHGSSPDSATMERTSHELIAHGPGKCEIRTSCDIEEISEWIKSESLNIKLRISPIDAEMPVDINVSVKQEDNSRNNILSWKLREIG